MLSLFSMAFLNIFRDSHMSERFEIILMNPSLLSIITNDLSW